MLRANAEYLAFRPYCTVSSGCSCSSSAFAAAIMALKDRYTGRRHRGCVRQAERQRFGVDVF
jgi:hypothetical protein